MRFKLLLIFSLVSSVLFGQKEYAHGLLDILCSDSLAGRGYVENGLKKSSNFLVKELKNIGVSKFPNKPYTQPYHFGVNTFPTAIKVRVDDDVMSIGKDYIIDPNSGQTVGVFESVLVSIENYGDVLKEFVGGHQANKILVFDTGDYKSKDTLAMFMQLAIEATEYYPTIWLTQRKLTYSVGRKQMKNAMVILKKSANEIGKKVSIDIQPAFKKRFLSENVIGYIEGKKANKFLVVTGHYDHLGKMGQAIFPGGNDNASGVAMMLSLAKHYKINKPKYSIVFIFFSGEEAGLEGSKYFVQNPYFELNKVKFLLNIDIMGSASKGITAVNGSVHKKHFKRLSRINKKYKLLPQVKKRGPTKNSDHYYFSQTGVPSFFIYSMGDIINYHDINDTAENTNLGNFNKVLTLFIKFLNKV